MKQGNITIRRLRKCVRILRSIKEPTKLQADGNPAFCMRHFVHTCGTPSCVIGWYASETPERWELKPKNEENRFRFGNLIYTQSPHRSANPFYYALPKEFPSLRGDELRELFEASGCGNAGSDNNKAADYIDRFIQRKLAEG